MRILVLSFYYPPDIGPGPLRAKSLVRALKRQDRTVIIDVMTTMPNRYRSVNIDAQEFEENDKIGQINTLSNSVSYKIDENNFFTFKTRRNRKINLTEYYDLVYEYKNDCLTAGIKYNKTYYSDGDLKPTENLLFTITLIPLTTYEYQASDMLQN